jgi:hypothetical protein
MNALVCLQITLSTEGFITYITGKWSPPIMYALMFLQTTLLPE